MWIQGMRYKKIKDHETGMCHYEQDDKGKHLALPGPMGSCGYLDLSVNTFMGLPIDPNIGNPYANEGFTTDEE